MIVIDVPMLSPTYLNYCVQIGRSAEFHLCFCFEKRLLQDLKSLQCPERIGVAEIVELQVLGNRCSRHSSANSWTARENDHHRLTLAGFISLKIGVQEGRKDKAL